jgi:hypothetical protein
VGACGFSKGAVWWLHPQLQGRVVRAAVRKTITPKEVSPKHHGRPSR